MLRVISSNKLASRKTHLDIIPCEHHKTNNENCVYKLFEFGFADN